MGSMETCAGVRAQFAKLVEAQVNIQTMLLSEYQGKLPMGSAATNSSNHSAVEAHSTKTAPMWSAFVTEPSEDITLTGISTNANEEDVLDNAYYRIGIIAFYVTICLIGIVSNTVVLKLVLCMKGSLNSTMIFISVLATADLMQCCVDLPVQLHYSLTKRWVLGHVLCAIVPPTFIVPVHVSTLTMMAIAADRYHLIVHPTHRKMPPRIAWSVVVGLTLFPLLVALPSMLQSEYCELSSTKLKIYRAVCMSSWSHITARRLYSVTVFCINFALPITVTAACYLFIGIRLWRRLEEHPHSNQELVADKTKRTTWMLVAIVTIYVVCWLPHSALVLHMEFYGHQYVAAVGGYNRFIDLLLKGLGCLCTCINPVFYGFLNESLRNGKIGGKLLVTVHGTDTHMRTLGTTPLSRREGRMCTRTASPPESVPLVDQGCGQPGVQGENGREEFKTREKVDDGYKVYTGNDIAETDV